MNSFLMIQTVSFLVCIIPIMVVFTYILQAVVDAGRWIIKGLTAPEHVSEPAAPPPKPVALQSPPRKYRDREDFTRDNLGDASIHDMVDRCEGEVPPKKPEKDIEFLS